MGQRHKHGYAIDDLQSRTLVGALFSSHPALLGGSAQLNTKSGLWASPNFPPAAAALSLLCYDNPRARTLHFITHRAAFFKKYYMEYNT